MDLRGLGRLLTLVLMLERLAICGWPYVSTSLLSALFESSSFVIFLIVLQASDRRRSLLMLEAVSC